MNFSKLKLKIEDWKKLHNKITVLIFCVVILTLLFSFYLYNFIISPTFIKDGVKYTRNWKGEIIQSEEIVDNSSNNMIRAKVTEDIKVQGFEIVDTSQTPPLPTGINYYEDSNQNDVLKWNNYLIGFTRDYFVSEGGGGCFGGCGKTLQSTIRHIRVLNTSSGEVYSISLQKPTWGEISVISPQIIDNTYFLTVGDGGPRNAPFQYKLKLPPTRTSQIYKLEKPIGANIYKYGDVYISTSCYEGCFYQRVNLDTLESTELKRLNAAANGYIFNKAEELVGFTNQGEMVLSINPSGERVAVSLRDEKTARKLTLDEEIIGNDKELISETIQESFNKLRLDPKYVLVERNAKYPTSYIKIFNKNKLPKNAEVVE